MRCDDSSWRISIIIMLNHRDASSWFIVRIHHDGSSNLQHDDASRLICIMMICLDGSWWFIMLIQHDYSSWLVIANQYESWWIIGMHCDHAASRPVTMSHHDASWRIVTSHHDSSWRIMSIRHDASWWVIMINHDEPSLRMTVWPRKDSFQGCHGSFCHGRHP